MTMTREEAEQATASELSRVHKALTWTLGAMMVFAILGVYMATGFINRVETLTTEAEVAVLQIEDLAGSVRPAILSYDLTDPFPVSSVDRDSVTMSATPCFLGFVESAEITVDRRFSFPAGASTPDFTNVRGWSLPAIPRVVFNEDNLDDQNCSPFEDFEVGFPDDLVQLLDAHPEWSPTMVITYRVSPTNTTLEELPQPGRSVVVSSQRFTVPAGPGA